MEQIREVRRLVGWGARRRSPTAVFAKGEAPLQASRHAALVEGWSPAAIADIDYDASGAFWTAGKADRRHFCASVKEPGYTRLPGIGVSLTREVSTSRPGPAHPTNDDGISGPRFADSSVARMLAPLPSQHLGAALVHELPHRVVIPAQAD